MRATVEVITPDVAFELLQNIHPRQRCLRKAVVAEYADAMRAGEWPLTHQGIALDTQGRLADGMHRAWAIIEAGIECRMLVIRDVPEDAFAAIDRHRRRTIADALGREKDACAAVQAAFGYSDKDARLKVQLTATRVDELFERHADAIEFAVRNIINRNVRRVSVAPVAGIVIRAHMKYEHNVRALNRLADWCAVICSGEPMVMPDDVAALKARRIISEMKTVADLKHHSDVLLKLARSIELFVDRAQVKTLVAPLGNPFPIPEEYVSIAPIRRKLARVRIRAGRGEMITA